MNNRNSENVYGKSNLYSIYHKFICQYFNRKDKYSSLVLTTLYSKKGGVNESNKKIITN